MDRPPGGSRGGVNLGGGGSSGSTDNPTSKKIPFLTILNKISKKIFEKSLDLANLVNFADPPQGEG